MRETSLFLSDSRQSLRFTACSPADQRGSCVTPTTNAEVHCQGLRHTEESQGVRLEHACCFEINALGEASSSGAWQREFKKVSVLPLSLYQATRQAQPQPPRSSLPPHLLEQTSGFARNCLTQRPRCRADWAIGLVGKKGGGWICWEYSRKPFVVRNEEEGNKLMNITVLY